MLIETDFQEVPFVAVPRHVVALLGNGLSGDALAALVWLAARPKGAAVYVASVQRALGCGKDKWQRISRELRAVGALTVAPSFVEGRDLAVGKCLLVRWPEGGKTRLSGSERKAGKPGVPAGKPGGKRPENPAPSYTIQQPGAAPAAPSRAERAQAPGGGAAAAVQAAEPAEPAKPVARRNEPGTGAGAAQAAKRSEGGDGETGRYEKADGSARMGLHVRCPDSGDWLTAAEWRAKRAAMSSEVDRLLAG